MVGESLDSPLLRRIALDATIELHLCKWIARGPSNVEAHRAVVIGAATAGHEHERLAKGEGDIAAVVGLGLAGLRTL